MRRYEFYTKGHERRTLVAKNRETACQRFIAILSKWHPAMSWSEAYPVQVGDFGVSVVYQPCRTITDEQGNEHIIPVGPEFTCTLLREPQP